MSRFNWCDGRDASFARVNRLDFLCEPHEPLSAPRFLSREPRRRPDLKLKSIDLINMLRFLETVSRPDEVNESDVEAFLAKNNPMDGDSFGEFRIDAETNDCDLRGLGF